MSTISRIAGLALGVTFVVTVATFGWAFSSLHRQITTLEPLSARSTYRGFL